MIVTIVLSHPTTLLLIPFLLDFSKGDEIGTLKGLTLSSPTPAPVLPHSSLCCFPPLSPPPYYLVFAVIYIYIFILDLLVAILRSDRLSQSLQREVGRKSPDSSQNYFSFEFSSRDPNYTGTAGSPMGGEGGGVEWVGEGGMNECEKFTMPAMPAASSAAITLEEPPEETPWWWCGGNGEGGGMRPSKEEEEAAASGAGMGDLGGDAAALVGGHDGGSSSGKSRPPPIPNPYIASAARSAQLRAKDPSGGGRGETGTAIMPTATLPSPPHLSTTQDAAAATTTVLSSEMISANLKKEKAVVVDAPSNLEDACQKLVRSPLHLEMMQESVRGISQEAGSAEPPQDSRQRNLTDKRFLPTASILSESALPPSKFSNPVWIADASKIHLPISIAGNIKAYQRSAGEDALYEGTAEKVLQRPSDSTLDTEIMQDAPQVREKEQSRLKNQHFQDPVIAADGFTYERSKIEVHSNPILTYNISYVGKILVHFFQ